MQAKAAEEKAKRAPRKGPNGFGTKDGGWGPFLAAASPVSHALLLHSLRASCLRPAGENDNTRRKSTPATNHEIKNTETFTRTATKNTWFNTIAIHQTPATRPNAHDLAAGSAAGSMRAELPGLLGFQHVRRTRHPARRRQVRHGNRRCKFVWVPRRSVTRSQTMA